MNKAEIDLSKDAVIVIKGGEFETVDKPQTGYGQQVITWRENELKKVDVTHSKVYK